METAQEQVVQYCSREKDYSGEGLGWVGLGFMVFYPNQTIKALIKSFGVVSLVEIKDNCWFALKTNHN